MDEKAVRTALPKKFFFFELGYSKSRQFKGSGKCHIIRAMVQG